VRVVRIQPFSDIVAAHTILETTALSGLLEGLSLLPIMVIDEVCSHYVVVIVVWINSSAPDPSVVESPWYGQLTGLWSQTRRTDDPCHFCP
jgi:hypothetical protein